MAQARVTRYFPQRKKSSVHDTAQRKGRRKASTPTSSILGDNGNNSASPGHCTPSEDRSKTLSSSCSNSVHQDFVRNVAAAAATELVGEDAESDTSLAPGGQGDMPASPVTPKRTSVDADLSDVTSATNHYSTAKKRRQFDPTKHTQDPKTDRKTARKKLILPEAEETTEQCRADDPAESAALVHGAKAVEQKVPAARSSTRKHVGSSLGSKALSKEDLVALKSRIEAIKRQTENVASTPSTKSTLVARDEDTTPKTQPIDIAVLKKRVARAKELSAKSTKTAKPVTPQEQDGKEGSEKTESQDNGNVPAYERYHTLAQDEAPGLALPYQYRLLAEMFRSADTIVCMLYNRSETVTFAKVKQGVQDMMRKHFEQSHLGQIKAVFPGAYAFTQERNIPTFNSNIKKGSYQLTLEPVISTDGNEPRPLLTASLLLERRRVFHQNLVCLVKQHHKTFLASLVPPLLVPEDKLTRWHPRFQLDVVPAVPSSQLPQPPHVEKLTTAQEVLDRARSLLTPKMEKALNCAASKTTAASAGCEDPQPMVTVRPTANVTPVPATATSKALNGVSQALLDRIRAKEAQKLEATMTRNPAHEQRLLMMSRLQELSRILRTVFVAEKKPALIMEMACNRMVASYRSALTAAEMEKHLQLLAELVPDWLTIHPVRKDLYLKLCKNMDLNIVQDKLSLRLKEEERL